MWFWWFMFVCDLFIPVFMIICGRIPPKVSMELLVTEQHVLCKIRIHGDLPMIIAEGCGSFKKKLYR